jgi:putative transposase
MAKPSRPSDPQNSKGEPRTFFLTTSAFGGRSLFQTDRMADLLIDVLRSYTLAGKFKVHDFVIMRNHVHVLLTVPGDVSVEKAAQLIKGGFSFRAKKELGFLGEIWQRGFSDVRITDEKSFRTHQEYIYSNPVRAGVVSQPEEYRYSSVYLRRMKRAGAEAHIKEAGDGTTEVVP